MPGEKPISALHIPVEIFVLFLIQNKKDFKVQDVIDEFERTHKVTLTHKRTKQILDEFVEFGKLTKEMKPNGSKNKETAHYIFCKLY